MLVRDTFFVVILPHITHIASQNSEKQRLIRFGMIGVAQGHHRQTVHAVGTFYQLKWHENFQFESNCLHFPSKRLSPGTWEPTKTSA